jgi:hypothetical protein
MSRVCLWGHVRIIIQDCTETLVFYVYIVIDARRVPYTCLLELPDDVYYTVVLTTRTRPRRLCWRVDTVPRVASLAYAD